jgi:hypothetical protein
MAVKARSASLLAEVLLGDIEQIAECTAARMQELLPSYARVSREALISVLLPDTRHLLEAVRDADADRGRAEIDDRALGETRARQGSRATSSFRGGESVWRSCARRRTRGPTSRDRRLRTARLCRATLVWGDVGVRALVSAHCEVEIGGSPPARRVGTWPPPTRPFL